ncbi:MAG: type II toxin-antitoxin system prevent-host-death family antitoxin [Candidatus Limnocylindria bacterium]
MTTERAGRKAEEPAKAHPISELQRDAPEIVREASQRGEVEITRYGATVAYVVSPQERRRAQWLERVVTRAVVAEQYRRAWEDLEAGNVVEWEEVEAELRERFGP